MSQKYEPPSEPLDNGDGKSPGVFPPPPERDFFVEKLLVRIHFIIEMIWWTDLAP